MHDFSNHLFRCSALGSIMGYADKDALPVGAITALNQIWWEEVYNRREEIKSKYLSKGIEREEDAITLLCRNLGFLLKKNEERLNNKFITGLPDLFLGEAIMKCEAGWDTKCSFTWKTFPKNEVAKNIDYEWQNQGYMGLTGAKVWSTCYCLVNSSPNTIDDEKKSMYFKEKFFDESNPEYLEKCKRIEQDHIVDLASFKKEFPHYDLSTPVSEWKYDIPMKSRVRIVKYERDEIKISQIYARVKLARKYLNAKEF